MYCKVDVGSIWGRCGRGRGSGVRKRLSLLLKRASLRSSLLIRTICPLRISEHEHTKRTQEMMFADWAQ